MTVEELGAYMALNKDEMEDSQEPKEEPSETGNGQIHCLQIQPYKQGGSSCCLLVDTNNNDNEQEINKVWANLLCTALQ